MSFDPLVHLQTIILQLTWNKKEISLVIRFLRKTISNLNYILNGYLSIYKNFLDFANIFKYKIMSLEEKLIYLNFKKLEFIYDVLCIYLRNVAMKLQLVWVPSFTLENKENKTFVFLINEEC